MSSNIREMIHAGHPRAQAIAAALDTARRYGKKYAAGGKVDRKHDIPYLAGISKNNRCLYVDRRVPKTLTIKGRTFDPAKYLRVHETHEHMLMTKHRMPYEKAHQSATEREKAAVKADGIDWNGYEAEMRGYANETEHEKHARKPKDLYLGPYKKADGGAVEKPYTEDQLREWEETNRPGPGKELPSQPAKSFSLGDAANWAYDKSKEAYAAAGEQFGSGVEKLRHGDILPRTPHFDPSTWEPGGLLQAGVGAGSGIAALTGLTAAAKATGMGATQLTGNPEFGEKVEFGVYLVNPFAVVKGAGAAGSAAMRQAEKIAGSDTGIGRLARDESGLFAGINSTKANHEKLAKAEKMEGAGADRDQIWQDTGWGRDPSGKWMHEISDEKAKLHPDLPVSEQNPKHVYLPPGGYMALDKFLPHPELYEAYPFLKDYKVMGSIFKDENLGTHFPQEKIIAVSPQSRKSMLSTVLHEVNHAVQVHEDFAPGGSWKNFVPPEYHEMAAKLDFQEKSVVEHLRKWNIPVRDAIKVLAKAVKDPGKITNAEIPIIKQVLDSGKYGDFANFIEQTELHAKLKEQAIQNYYKMAGEAASRNVEVRRGLPTTIPPDRTMEFMNHPVSFNDLIINPEQARVNWPQESRGQASLREPVPEPLPVQNELGFTSKARETAIRGPSRATAAQWESTLKNAGVKDEEIKTLKLDGMFSWFKDKHPSETISKDNILKHIDENRVQLKEHVTKDTGESPFLPDDVAWEREQRRLEDHGPVEEAQAREQWAPEADDIPPAPEELWGPPQGEGDYGRQTKWHDMVLPGGKNYHEIKWELQSPHKPEEPFFNSHYETENQLAEARVDEREINGEKTLFSHEWQSDWHQRGARVGYATDPLKSGWRVIDHGATPGVPRQNTYEITGPNGEREYLTATQNLPSRRVLERSQHFAESGSSIPDAPYKKNWDQMVVKRLLRYAVENGFEQFAWPGAPKTVAKIENWPTEMLAYKDGKWMVRDKQDVTPIINRYTREIPSFLNKMGKRFGVSVEDAVSGVYPVKIIKLTPEFKRSIMQHGFNDFKRGGAVKTYVRKYAGGGGVSHDHWLMHQASRNLHAEGAIKSPIPGRTDKIGMSVPAGAYILTADTVSHLGQNNTDAGQAIVKSMFSRGPMGMAPMRGGRSGARPMIRPQSPKMPKYGFAEGGEADGDGSEEWVPIIGAGGEAVVHPDVVKHYGNGSLTAGHKVLDKFQAMVRKDHQKTLAKLKPPKQ